MFSAMFSDFAALQRDFSCGLNAVAQHCYNDDFFYKFIFTDFPTSLWPLASSASPATVDAAGP